MKPLEILSALLVVISSACAGDLSNYYFKHLQDDTNWIQTYGSAGKGSRTWEQLASTNHGISEISIERAGSIWGGPVYTFIARSDGTFEYLGYKGVERTGQFSGTISAWEFHQLARFIRDSGYVSFRNQYRVNATDLSTTYTSVVLDGKRKVISNYGDGGPTTLWAIEQLIDDLMRKAEWKLILPKAPKPVLPQVTRYDHDPVLRTAYLEFFSKGYSDAWEQKENLPPPGSADADKARTLGYADGMVAGRAARAQWFGTNSQDKVSERK